MHGAASGRRRAPPAGSGLPTLHQQAPHLYLHRFTVLIARRVAHLDQPLVRTRLRGANLEDLALDREFVARAYRARPAEFLEAEPDDAAGGLELALDEKAHRDRC